MMKLAVSGLCSLFQTVVLVRIGFDAWCAAYGHMSNAPMAIVNINTKIVNRARKMHVVDSQCQYPFMVACLLNIEKKLRYRVP